MIIISNNAELIYTNCIYVYHNWTQRIYFCVCFAWMSLEGDNGGIGVILVHWKGDDCKDLKTNKVTNKEKVMKDGNKEVACLCGEDKRVCRW